MEVVQHRCRVSPEDVISRMPDDVIANIMDRLPLKDAVATCILSPSWRFKWTLLTQLILDSNFFDTLLRQKNHFDKTIISRLLLHLKVTKFSLTITSDIKLEDADIHHWVMLLSKIPGFKELALLNCRETPFKLPTHFFSCLDLKHLKLERCVFPSYFRGFPKLLTLDLHNNASNQDQKYGEVIAQCPLLETLKVWDSNLRGGVKLFEIAKLENVKVLDLSLCLLENMTMLRLSSVFQHISLLPKLQELCLRCENCMFLPEDVAQDPVSVNFPFLETLSFCQMDFSSASMLSCAFRMLFGCTNLQTLFISATYKNVVPLSSIFSTDCSTIGQLPPQLQKVKLVFIRGLENEVCLIKYLLACSPVLKSIEILLTPYIKIDDNEKYKLACELLKLHRASPMAEIVVYS